MKEHRAACPQAGLSPAALRRAEVTSNPLAGIGSQGSPHHSDCTRQTCAERDTLLAPASREENIRGVTKIIGKRANAIPCHHAFFFNADFMVFHFQPF